jgi:hypothetical protein
MRPEKPHRKQIKINYEVQFSIKAILKDKIKKIIIKNKKKSKSN